MGILSTLSATFFLFATAATDLEQWHKRREESLTAPHGWLSLISRDKMAPGKHAVGADAKSAVKLPQAACGHCADLEVAGGKAWITPVQGSKILVDAKPIQGKTAVFTKSKVEIDRFRVGFVERDGEIAVRVMDPQSPARAAFKGCQWFAPNPAAIVKAKFEKAPKHQEEIALEDITGRVRPEKIVGKLSFKLGGKPQTLLALDGEPGLFLIFRDQTTGKTTYGGGRFLGVEKAPAPGGEVTLDFNRAYSPPCAFSKFTTCPIPPKENSLTVAVEAGERLGK